MPSFKRENLIVLMYASNNCCTKVVLPDDPRVKESGAIIDEEKGIWSAPNSEDPAREPQIQKIGQSRHIFRGCRHGVIGVYDRTNFKHLEAIVYDGCEAVRDTGSLIDDD